jgi:hypothetical protein
MSDSFFFGSVRICGNFFRIVCFSRRKFVETKGRSLRREAARSVCTVTRHEKRLDLNKGTCKKGLLAVHSCPRCQLPSASDLEEFVSEIIRGVKAHEEREHAIWRNLYFLVRTQIT